MTPLLLIAAQTLLAGAAGASAPQVEIWYGAHQVFGHNGVPQRWVNVLGNADDPDGIRSLTWSLNGGPHQPLSVGPDDRRLRDRGDFNVELDVRELRPGTNKVVIAATDTLDHQTLEEVTVELAEPRSNTSAYSIDWGSVDNVQKVCQIVDGRWAADDSGLRLHPEHTGYDRMVAIGDVGWRDYEITVPITIHAVDDAAFSSAHGAAPGVGVLLRWQGHSDRPVAGVRPRAGWLPGCGSNWFRWNDGAPGVLNLFAGPTRRPAPISAQSDALQLETGSTYWFRARVETTPVGSLYSLRAWRADDTEPPAWQLQRLTTGAHLPRGSLLFNAHFVDVTFGDVEITRLDDGSLWNLFTELSSFLQYSPLLLAALLGLVLAYLGRRRSSRAARWGMVAAALLIVAYAGKALASLYLPALLEGADGWSAEGVTKAAVVVEFVFSGVIAVAWVLVLCAALFGRERGGSPGASAPPNEPTAST